MLLVYLLDLIFADELVCVVVLTLVLSCRVYLVTDVIGWGLPVTYVFESLCNIIHHRVDNLASICSSGSGHSTQGEWVRVTLCPQIDRPRPLREFEVRGRCILFLMGQTRSSSILLLLFHFSNLLRDRLLRHSKSILVHRKACRVISGVDSDFHVSCWALDQACE